MVSSFCVVKNMFGLCPFGLSRIRLGSQELISVAVRVYLCRMHVCVHIYTIYYCAHTLYVVYDIYYIEQYCFFALTSNKRHKTFWFNSCQFSLASTLYRNSRSSLKSLSDWLSVIVGTA